jgi:nucleoside-diphosphate-sugar epimerase
MSQTALIFGGSGKVSRQLTKLLASQTPPWKVYSIIRSAAQTESLTALGATPIVQSIEDSSVSSLAATIKKCAPNVVIWSAGAGGGDPSRTDKVDREGAIKSMDACAEAGVKRYIIVSALDMRDRDNKPVPDWYDKGDLERSDKIWGGIGAYMRAKLAADKELRTGNGKRGLDYTIVRPGGLTEEPGAGTVAAGKVHLSKQISREDVARVVFECIQNDGTIGMAFDAVGGNMPIADAVKKVVDNKEDCFEGYY